tara:strand:+ start:25 stop:495 length:471 start_codon:yes stop_codon:yes gene_type:complete
MDISEHLHILNKKQQSALLKFIDKELTHITSYSKKYYPGLQTYADLQHYKELQPLIKSLKDYIHESFIITKCWANHTDGGYTSWHSHTADLSVVYYLKNKESLGTLFKVNNKIISFKAPENSLIIFKHQTHSVPPRKKGTPKLNRYSIAFEISLKM